MKAKMRGNESFDYLQEGYCPAVAACSCSASHRRPTSIPVLAGEFGQLPPWRSDEPLRPSLSFFSGDFCACACCERASSADVCTRTGSRRILRRVGTANQSKSRDLWRASEKIGQLSE